MVEETINIMLKPYKLVNPCSSSGQSSDIVPSTNWNFFFLCQDDKPGETLICPAKRTDGKSGYDYIANNLLEFDKINRIPLNVNLHRLNDGCGIVEALRSHQAVHHKLCYLKFRNEN